MQFYEKGTTVFSPRNNTTLAHWLCLVLQLQYLLQPMDKSASVSRTIA